MKKKWLLTCTPGDVHIMYVIVQASWSGYQKTKNLCFCLFNVNEGMRENDIEREWKKRELKK